MKSTRHSTEHSHPLPEIDLQQCTRCGLCAQICPAQALALDENRQPYFDNPQACTFCTACEDVCPAGAIRCAFEIRWETPE